MKAIVSILETISTQGISSFLVQFWAATKGNRKIHLLTTTCQPFGLYGNNEKLEAYRQACLHHKLYVYEDSTQEEGTAFGLPGRVFLKRAPEQTLNVHDYHEDERPPCEDAIFKWIWGSYAVPMFEAGKRIGVLEFVTDTLKDSYNDDIVAANNALQDAGFQSSIQINRPRELKMISGKKRKRKTKTWYITKYRCLVPFLGLSKAIAAEKLGHASATKKPIIESTFRNLRENVGIPEWPWIKQNQTESETSSCVTRSTDLTSIQGDGFPEMPGEQPVTDIPSSQETGMNQIPDSMLEYGEMEYPFDFMDVEELINFDYLINADLMSNNIRDEGNSVITSDIEASIAYPRYGDMEYHGNNASITEDTDIMDIHNNNFMDSEGINEFLYKYGV